MVNLITGPKGSGKTQQMIELANEKVKTSNGNVVLIKKSHRDTISVDFSVRAICMADYKEISSLDAFVGFIYGMIAGNHDIETIFIDGILKQADISIHNLLIFLEKIDVISRENNIEFFVSISAEKKDIPDINPDSPNFTFLN